MKFSFKEARFFMNQIPLSVHISESLMEHWSRLRTPIENGFLTLIAGSVNNSRTFISLNPLDAGLDRLHPLSIISRFGKIIFDWLYTFEPQTIHHLWIQ